MPNLQLEDPGHATQHVLENRHGVVDVSRRRRGDRTGLRPGPRCAPHRCCPRRRKKGGPRRFAREDERQVWLRRIYVGTFVAVLFYTEVPWAGLLLELGR